VAAPTMWPEYLSTLAYLATGVNKLAEK
jgi:hypothetical protein